jgi:ornithine cyclodeaminase/alanine dehydrogenase-like protein (mu-crystallin family)
MLLLSRAEVESLLDPDLLRGAVGAALADLSAGRASMPTRIGALVNERDGLFAMPAYLPTAGALTTKLVTLFPRNTDRPTHQAVIVAFDAATGSPIALLDGEAITAARTAAASALATDLLARQAVHRLVVIGTGVQARAHLKALSRVRQFGSICVVGRDHAKASALARELGANSDQRVSASADVERAVREADVVCACTHSAEPVVRREWLRNGVHVNSVGYNTAGREVDESTVADALLVVESRTAVLAAPPSGSNDINWPIRDGRITKDHIHAELGELVSGARPGRANDQQITVYKAVGVAVEDAAATALVLRLAKERGVGRTVDL